MNMELIQEISNRNHNHRLKNDLKIPVRSALLFAGVFFFRKKILLIFDTYCNLQYVHMYELSLW